jgi:hypothetical protein
VETALSRDFDWTVAAQRTRCMAVDRYDGHEPGLLAHLERLADDGVARVRRRGALLEWDARVLSAVRR